MQKHLFLLSIAFISFKAYGQSSIPNGNFETWTSSTYDYPQNYPSNSNSDNFLSHNLPPNVTKTIDAYHGTYAVQLTTNASATDTSFGYFLNTNPNGPPSSWTGGMPYNQKPAGIRGYFKYNVALTDSATIIVTFSKSGSNIGSYFFKIGGIHNTYTLFHFTFNPALTVTPDSVIFGALSCNFNPSSQQPHGPAGSTLILDSVSFTGVNSQPALMNGDFELWQSQTYNNLANWNAQSGGGGSNNGVNQTSDAKAGNYAVELITHLGNQNNHPAAQSGRISTGYYPNNCNGNCYEQGGYPYANQIDTLVFWYKYIPSGNDTASIYVNFKKNHSSVWSTGINIHSAALYTYMEIPFNIGQSPDSVMIDVQSSSWRDSSLSFVGSDLKIDEIHFKSQPLHTDIMNYENENSIRVFPNPTNGMIHIQCLGSSVQNMEIYNMFGEKVYTINNFKQQITNEIDLSSFQKGIYFMKINNGEKSYLNKIVIQ